MRNDLHKTQKLDGVAPQDLSFEHAQNRFPDWKIERGRKQRDFLWTVCQSW